MNEQTNETPAYRVLPDGRVLVMVDGAEYLHTGGFNTAKSQDTTDEVLQAFAAAIRKYHPNANKAEYITMNIDGMEHLYRAGCGTPMAMEVEMHLQDIKLNKAVMRIDTTADGYKQPIFYSEALEMHKAQLRKELMAKMRKYYKAADRKQTLGAQIRTDKEKLAKVAKDLQEARAARTSETECRQYLVWMIKEQGVKWPELLEAVKRHKALGQLNWELGKYRTPEDLAAAAVDEALELSDILETEYNCSLRTIADYMQMPYTLLLHTYTLLYIEQQKSKPIQCKYIPYELWIKTEQK